MDGNEDPSGGPSHNYNKKIKRKNDELNKSSGGESDKNIYAPYLKPNYKRLYPENSTNLEFKVFVQSVKDNDKLGNKSPVYLNHIFSNEIKGVTAMHRVNANKIAVVFKQFNTANNFISNTAFLDKYSFKAFIPAREIENTGVIRFVPTNLSNKELYTKLSSDYEIISIRRFTKKIGKEIAPLQTVSITFLSNTLPDRVQYNLFSYRVFKYIPPLLQCFRCFKFNHSAKVCNNKQKCSICSLEHYYKDCDNPGCIKCVNCGGEHLAISRECPIKIKNILDKKNKITYAQIINTNSLVDFPKLTPNNDSKTISNIVTTKIDKSNKKNELQRVNNLSDYKELIDDSSFVKIIVQTILELSNSKGPMNTKRIKDIFLEKLNNGD